MSSDKLEFLSVGDTMVNDHPLWLGRSVFIVHIRSDMLLKTATKKLCFFARKEVGFKLCAPAAGGEEDRKEFIRTRMYFLFAFEGVLIRNGL